MLRALRQQRLRRAARHGHGVPQVQHQHQRRRRIPQEPGRRARQPAAGRGQRVQGEQRRRRAGCRAVPGRPRRGRLRDVPRPGGRPAQGYLRHRAGRRRVPRAVLRQVLGQRLPLPPHARLFAGRRREDHRDSHWHLRGTGNLGGVRLVAEEEMLAGPGTAELPLSGEGKRTKNA